MQLLLSRPMAEAEVPVASGQSTPTEHHGTETVGVRSLLKIDTAIAKYEADMDAAASARANAVTAANSARDSALAALQKTDSDFEHLFTNLDERITQALSVLASDPRTAPYMSPKALQATAYAPRAITGFGALDQEVNLGIRAANDVATRARQRHFRRKLVEEAADLLGTTRATLVASRSAHIRESKRRWNEIHQSYQHSLADIDRHFQDASAKALFEYRPLLDEFTAEAALWGRELDEVSPPWDSPSWSTWAPPTRAPRAVRFGRLATRSTLPGLLAAPSEWSLDPGQSLLLWRDSASSRPQVQSLILRILAQFPPGTARFTFLDPLGAGQAVAPFLTLADYDDQLVGGRVWSDPRHIDERLTELQDHVEMVVQKYLRGQYRTIAEHNLAAEEVAEAYRFLVVFDFPANFTESAVRSLISIARNGPASGVFSILLGNEGQVPSFGFDWAPFVSSMATYVPTGAGFRRVTDAALAVRSFPETPPDRPTSGLSPWIVEPDAPPALTLSSPNDDPNTFTRILKGVGAASKSASSVEVSESRLLELLQGLYEVGLVDQLPVLELVPDLARPSTWWTGSTIRGIVAPIGRSGARSIQTAALVGDDTSVHALIAGLPGSGKSTLLHALILNLCLVYSPYELELFLLDFKKGVGFKPYAVHGLPHSRVVAIDSEREFGLSVLHGLETEIARRGDLFRESGSDNLSAYRTATKQAMSRIVLIADEFQVLFDDDDTIATESARILDTIVRQGRAFGVHLVLSSQTMAGVHQVGRATLNQIAVRIALQCAESDSLVIFGEDNPEARLLSRPGEAIYNAMTGRREGNKRFQVALIKEEERERLLTALRDKADASGFARQPVVFEGTESAHLASNDAFQSLLASAPVAGREFLCWLGAPASLTGPTTAQLQRRAGAHLLVVGQDPERVDGILGSALVGLVPQLGTRDDPRSSTLDIVDFGGLDEPFALLAEHIERWGRASVTVSRRRQFAPVLDRLASAVEERLKAPSEDHPAALLVLHRLNSARDLDTSFDSLNGDDATASLHRMLLVILRDGPEIGVHVLATADTMSNVDRRLEHPAQQEFGLRVATRMSEADSMRLIDTQRAASLTGAQALLYDENRANIEKFRGYRLPSLTWLRSLETMPGWGVSNAVPHSPSGLEGAQDA